ncbi:MAG: alpha/beta fold hydrolase [Candidatus Eremiobacteraeota bacterium]|nr:alpha/beta fold hydrolase [Candidatus Eremiobacteraeota bacterium]
MIHHEQFLTLSMGRVRYKESGTGFPVILLHGNGGDLESWASTIGPMARKFRVIAPDLPGYGRSEKPSSFSIEMLVASVAEIARHFSLTRVHLVGNSLGGVVAIECATRFPELVERIVLVGTPSVDKNELEKTLSTLTTWIKADGTPRVSVEDARLVFPGADTKITALMNESLAQAGITFSTANEALRSYDMKGALASFSKPALIIWGDQDRITSINHAWILSRLMGGAPVWLIKGGGHSPQVDKPGEFNRMLGEFLSGPGRPDEKTRKIRGNAGK